MGRDLYEVLGVPRAATRGPSSAASGKPRKYHPASTRSPARRTSKEISQAYSVLSDPDKKARYDQFGEAGLGGGGGGPAASRRSPACPACQGTGQSVEAYCAKCNGQGVERKAKQVSVTIPCGVDAGNRLRVAGEGDAGPRGGAAGDLYIFLDVKKDPIFTRDGVDVASSMEVSAADAALGCSVATPTLDEDACEVKVPGHAAGHEAPPQGQGAPALSKPAQRGDLYVTVNVKVPTSPSDEERRLMEQLRDLQAKAGGGALFDGQKRRVPACGAMSSRPRSRDVGGLTPLQPALRYRTPSGAARTGKKSKGRLKKLEQGWDGRRSTGLPDYNALSDKYCVFTRGDAFRKHFTEMVGSAAARRRGATTGPERLPEDDMPPLYAAWRARTGRESPKPEEPQPVSYVEEPRTPWADPRFEPPPTDGAAPQIAVRLRARNRGFVDYDANGRRDLRKTVEEAEMLPGTNPRFSFVYADGVPISLKEEPKTKVRSFGAHVFVSLQKGEAPRRKRGVVDPATDDEAMEARVHPKTSLASKKAQKRDYSHLPVVSYAAAFRGEKAEVLKLIRGSAAARRRRSRPRPRRRSSSPAAPLRGPLLEPGGVGAVLYKGAVQDASGTHLLLSMMDHPDGVVLEAYGALSDDRYDGAVRKDALVEQVPDWEAFELERRAAVCAALALTTRVHGDRVACDVAALGLSSREWFPAQMPGAGSLDGASFTRELDNERLTEDPLLCSALRSSAARTDVLVGPDGKLALAVRASPRPDINALLAPTGPQKPAPKVEPYVPPGGDDGFYDDGSEEEAAAEQPPEKVPALLAKKAPAEKRAAAPKKKPAAPKKKAFPAPAPAVAAPGEPPAGGAAVADPIVDAPLFEDAPPAAAAADAAKGGAAAEAPPAVAEEPSVISTTLAPAEDPQADAPVLHAAATADGGAVDVVPADDGKLRLVAEDGSAVEMALAAEVSQASRVDAEGSVVLELDTRVGELVEDQKLARVPAPRPRQARRRAGARDCAPPPDLPAGADGTFVPEADDVFVDADGDAAYVDPRTGAAVKIEARFRTKAAQQQWAEQKNAVVKLQSSNRQLLAKQKVAGIRAENSAATTLQSAQRAHDAKARVDGIRAENSAATTLQSAQRAHDAKARVDGIRQDNAENAAATKLQAANRGHAAKQHWDEQQAAVATLEGAQRCKNARRKPAPGEAGYDDFEEYDDDFGDEGFEDGAAGEAPASAAAGAAAAAPAPAAAPGAASRGASPTRASTSPSPRRSSSAASRGASAARQRRAGVAPAAKLLEVAAGAAYVEGLEASGGDAAFAAGHAEAAVETVRSAAAASGGGAAPSGAGVLGAPAPAVDARVAEAPAAAPPAAAMAAPVPAFADESQVAPPPVWARQRRAVAAAAPAVAAAPIAAAPVAAAPVAAAAPAPVVESAPPATIAVLAPPAPAAAPAAAAQFDYGALASDTASDAMSSASRGVTAASPKKGDGAPASFFDGEAPPPPLEAAAAAPGTAVADPIEPEADEDTDSVVPGFVENSNLARAEAPRRACRRATRRRTSSRPRPRPARARRSSRRPPRCRRSPSRRGARRRGARRAARRRGGRRGRGRGVRARARGAPAGGRGRRREGQGGGHRRRRGGDGPRARRGVVAEDEEAAPRRVALPGRRRGVRAGRGARGRRRGRAGRGAGRRRRRRAGGARRAVGVFVVAPAAAPADVAAPAAASSLVDDEASVSTCSSPPRRIDVGEAISTIGTAFQSGRYLVTSYWSKRGRLLVKGFDPATDSAYQGCFDDYEWEPLGYGPLAGLDESTKPGFCRKVASHLKMGNGGALILDGRPATPGTPLFDAGDLPEDGWASPLASPGTFDDVRDDDTVSALPLDADTYYEAGVERSVDRDLDACSLETFPFADDAARYPRRVASCGALVASRSLVVAFTALSPSSLRLDAYDMLTMEQLSATVHESGWAFAGYGALASMGRDGVIGMCHALSRHLSIVDGVLTLAEAADAPPADGDEFAVQETADGYLAFSRGALGVTVGPEDWRPTGYGALAGLDDADKADLCALIGSLIVVTSDDLVFVDWPKPRPARRQRPRRRAASAVASGASARARGARRGHGRRRRAPAPALDDDASVTSALSEQTLTSPCPSGARSTGRGAGPRAPSA
ncbi:hypothetical protein JL720_9920 [Aureococcus anophagefferens]|nr:hypothetical protein JL720_9920 [Aureococcus anophagefferens]